MRLVACLEEGWGVLIMGFGPIPAFLSLFSAFDSIAWINSLGLGNWFMIVTG